MKHTFTTVAFVAIAMCAAAGLAGAQQTQPSWQAGPKADIPANLRAEAKVSESSARVTALAQVPNGKIEAAELEQENGKLLYSYDIQVPGNSGIQEVQINAIDGRVVGVAHEGPADMQKEASADRKAAQRHHVNKGEEAGEGYEGPERPGGL